MFSFGRGKEAAGAVVEQVPTSSKLEAIAKAQTDRLIELGFHREVYPHLSPEEAEAFYRNDLAVPEFTNQPKEYEGRLDMVLVVDPRIQLPRQHRLAQVGGYTTSEVQNYVSYPNHPYIAFIHDRQIAPYGYKDEAKSPQVEVTSLYLQHPELFRYKGFCAPGSRLAPYGWESFHSPAIILDRGRPEVIGFVPDNLFAQHVSSPLLRGKKVLPLGGGESLR